MKTPSYLVVIGLVLGGVGVAYLSLVGHPAGADGAESFDRFKQQMATFQTVRAWVGVRPPVPQGESTGRCVMGSRPWCPTGWILAADASGRISADAIEMTTTYERTLLIDGQVITYVPGFDEQRQPNAAVGMLMSRSFQFVRQELQPLQYAQGTAQVLGLPTELMAPEAQYFRVTADLGLGAPVDLSFGFNAIGEWAALVVSVGGQITQVQVSEIVFDDDLGAEWFVPNAWPYNPPFLSPGGVRSLDRMRHPDP